MMYRVFYQYTDGRTNTSYFIESPIAYVSRIFKVFTHIEAVTVFEDFKMTLHLARQPNVPF